MSNFLPVEILFTHDFQGQLRKLAKRYRNIRSDLQPLLNDLNRGNYPGDRISGFADFFIYKVRIKNSDIRKGKSGGYRVIYQSMNATTVLPDLWGLMYNKEQI